MKIDVVMTSVGYGDFLAATLPENKPLVDNIVVVTDPSDVETISVCRKHSIHYVASEDHSRGGPFNKGRLIQRGFDQIGAKDWIIHMDADVVLPAKFRDLVESADLQTSTIYGADRCNVVGWDSWQALKKYAGRWDNHAHECGHWFHPTFPVGSRWVSSIHGYSPIGAFQMFHSSAMIDDGYHVRKYPFAHGDAARTDMQFSLQWDRKYRQIIPEVILLHLESEKAELGANWKGRKTVRFGPPFAASSPFRSPAS